MCKTSYVSYKNKAIRILQVGIIPDFWFEKSVGILDGINVRLMRILANKLQFIPKIVIPKSFLDGDKQV